MSNDSEKIKELEKSHKKLEEEQEHFKHEVHAYVEENRSDHDLIRNHVSYIREDVDDIKLIANNNSKRLDKIIEQQTETKLLIARFKGAFGALVFIFSSIGIAAKISWEWFKAHK